MTIATGSSTSIFPTPLEGDLATVAHAEQIQSQKPLAETNSSALLTYRVLWPLVLTTLAVCTLGVSLRFSLASQLPWQIDEIPLISRMTGLCGSVANETEAEAFTPSLYSFRQGAIRSLRVPRSIVSMHTMAGFWSNATMHVFGASPLAGRVMPIFWSICGVVVAGWGAWLFLRSAVGACIAACLAALSPVGIAYGAQVRGYAESMALASLLLITIELLRRKPESLFRALAVFLCAFLASLSVYTCWAYWVFPVLGLAIIVVPRYANDPVQRRVLRRVLCLVFVGLVAVMGIYTLDRWSNLSFQARTMGRSLSTLPEVIGLLRDFFASHIVGPTIPVLVIMGIGFVVAIRSKQPWWVYVASGSILLPIAFAVANGQIGYVRNFAYLQFPVLLFLTAGAEFVLRPLAAKLKPAFASTVVTLIFLAWVSTSYGESAGRARSMLMPDWGSAIKSIEKEPSTTMPRWYCPDLAYHWVMNWYRPKQDLRAYLDLPFGGHMEVILGVAVPYGESATVYHVNQDASAYVGDPPPDYLAKLAPERTVAGIRVHRWTGTRVQADQLTGFDRDQPMLLLFAIASYADASYWRDHLGAGGFHEHGVITFKEQQQGSLRIESLVAPTERLRQMIGAAQSDGSKLSDKLHLFSLTALAEAKPTAN